MTHADQKYIKAGVVGWPISHSLSPRLHGYWLQQKRIVGAYQAYAVRPENLKVFLAGLSKENIIGVNLTVPHKEIVFPFLDQVDETARKIGAVNMVTVVEGKLQGRNTDGYGFLTNLREKAPSWKPESGPAVVIGAGGAARAAIVSLLDAGVPEIRLFNRTKTRAEKLVEIYASYYDRERLTVGNWSDVSHGLKGASLLINTTTLGMKGQPSLHLDLSSLPLEAVVYDIVYNPLETELLHAAQLRGNDTVDGLGMLLHQATPAFEAWFGETVTVDRALRAHVLEGLTDD